LAWWLGNRDARRIRHFVEVMMMFENETGGRSPRRKRWLPLLAGGAALGAASVFTLNTALISADEAKPAVGKADDKKPAEKKPDFKPEDVRVGAPPELDSLRKAVEDAAKKGENVDDIRKHLDSLEKALAGKAWVKPHVPAEPKPVERPRDGFGRVPAVPDFPALPAGPDMDAVRQMQAQIARAMEQLGKNPENPEALQKMIEDQRRLMLQALNGMGGRIAIAPGIGIGAADPLMGRGLRRGGQPRLGVQMEKVPLVVADQLGLPAGRGIVVAEVVPGMAAEKAGLKANDIIVEMAGQPVTDDMTEFAKRVLEAKAGEKIDFTIFRKGKKETVKVELPDAARRDRADADQPRGFGGFGGGQVGGGDTVRMSVVNGEFTINANAGGVEYTVKGRGENGKPTPNEIVIKDGDKTVKAESLDKVPAEYRAKVEKWLGGMRVGNVGRPAAQID